MVKPPVPKTLSPAATAAALMARGYYPIPITPGTKAATLRNWQELRLTTRDIGQYFPPEADNGVGVLLGVGGAPGYLPVGIDVDVDDQELIARIALAFDTIPPAKRGSKGITYFVRVPEPVKKRLLQRKDPITGAKANVVEILALGQQTVLPPTPHPKGMDYVWVGTPLHDVNPHELPELTPTAFREIEIAVNKPESALFGLNTMESGGGNGGGTIHNSVLAAVGVMVSVQWDDETIWKRVRRATRDALNTLDEPSREYDDDRWEPTVRKMIADARAKGFDQQTKKRKVHWHAARWLLDDYKGNGSVHVRNGILHVYESGWWKAISDEDARHLLATEWPEPPGVSFISEDWSKTVKTACDLAPRFPDKLPGHRVCLQNGTFDLDTGELLDWSPDDYLISQLPFRFDPDATCPTYEKAVYRAFLPIQNGHDIDPEDQQRSVDSYEEFVGHTLFECLEYHKFLVLKGKPRTGKSTLIQVAEMMHGEHAVSAVPVKDFDNEKYRAAMVGKLLNVVNEVAAMSHAADDFLKSVSAGDKVQVRFLYREPQLVQLPTRIIIACNELFKVRDTSGAIEERMIILSCDNFLKEDERDTKLGPKLRAELPGIFNRFTKAWHRLRDRGRFLPPTGSKHQIAEFGESNNVVLSWLKSRTWEFGLEEGDTMPPSVDRKPTENSVAYADCAEWIKQNGHMPISVITWGMKMSQIRPPEGITLIPRIIKVAGRSIRVRDITLIDRGKF